MDRRLESLLAICKTGSYHAAADELYLSQPALTKQIKSLEEEYHTKLLHYDGKSVQATPKGELLRQYAASAAYNEKEIKKALDMPETMHIRIGATKTIGDYVLLPFIRRFLEDNKHRLSFTVDNTEHLFRMLDGNELDFLIVEGLFDKQKYENCIFRKEPFVGICAPDHPFRNREISLEELLQEELILREPGSGTRNIFEQALRNLGYSINAFPRVSEISSFKLIRRLIAEGSAVSFAYQAVAEEQPELGTFTCRKITDIHEFSVAWLKGTNAKIYADIFLKSEN